MKLRPLHDRILIQQLDEEEQRGLIITPDAAKEKPNRGRVLACGPGELIEGKAERRPMDVKEGDLVVFGKYSPTSITVEGKELVMIREAEVLGVLEE